MDNGRAGSDSDRPGSIRPELADLVRALAALPDADRRDVVSAAEQAAARTRPTLPWDLWDRARGIVSIGGDSVEDSDRLYDGT